MGISWVLGLLLVGKGGLPAVIGPPDAVWLPGVVGLPGAAGCQLSLVSMEILSRVVILLSVSPVPIWPACLFWVLKVAGSRPFRLSLWTWHWPRGIFKQKRKLLYY